VLSAAPVTRAHSFGAGRVAPRRSALNARPSHSFHKTTAWSAECFYEAHASSLVWQRGRSPRIAQVCAHTRSGRERGLCSTRHRQRALPIHSIKPPRRAILTYDRVLTAASSDPVWQRHRRDLGQPAVVCSPPELGGQLRAAEVAAERLCRPQHVLSHSLGGDGRALRGGCGSPFALQRRP